MILKKRSFIVILALVLVVAMLAACAPRTEAPPDDQPPERPERPPVEIDPEWEGLRIGDITPDFAYEIAERFSVSDHTVGWVDVPGTNISDVVVRNPECTNNRYYERRNFYREFYFDGVFYADIRAQLGPTREYLGIGTTIYGHAMTDDLEDTENINRKFGNLHFFRDPEFMRYHPYIFFSLPEDNIAFEIMAVFYGNVSNPGFAYNTNHTNADWESGDPEDFIYVIRNAVLPRSLFIFDDIEFDATDRFLVLSTCIYNPSCGTVLMHHTETMYRFAIMARMLDPDTPLREYVNFTINEDRIADPDGRLQW